jgi:hypothetical protein
MALTTVALNALKPKDKPYKRADERGLYIEGNAQRLQAVAL